MKALPSYQKLWLENRDKGLNVFLFETDEGSKDDQVFAFLIARGIDIPCYVGAPEGYKGEGQPWHVVIDVDGKVAFSGNGHCEDVIKKELARVKYQGLGRQTFVPELEKAALAFSARQYTKALEEAGKVLEKEKESAAATDAQYIIDKINAVKAQLMAKVEAGPGEKDFAGVFKALETLSTGFKDTEEGKAAEAKLKELKADKTAKKEADAQAGFIKAREAMKAVKSKTEKAKVLRDFAKKYEETKAAEDARALAKRIEAT
ncbi:MAG: hypothetical protein IT462_15400 [Planctomycetes bacterium]|nr:hypothetical protein [Planctomycetota bacterium]